MRLFSKERGSAAMEAALVLPIVILVCMGVVEMGSMFRTWISLQKAAQEGARFATTGQGELEGNRLTRIKQTATDMLIAMPGGATPFVEVKSWENDTATGPYTLNDPGEPCKAVEVEVRYQYIPFTPFVDQFMPAEVVLTGKSLKVNEPWQPCQKP